LWQDPKERKWEKGQWYTWKLRHRIAKGLINVQFCCDNSGNPIESGDIYDLGDSYDTDYKGGRLGVYSLSQDGITFTDLNHTCPSDLDYALRFDGATGFVSIDDDISLCKNINVTVSIWINVETENKNGTLPVICSTESKWCIFVKNRIVNLRLNKHTVMGGEVKKGEWMYIAGVYDSQGKTLTLYINNNVVDSKDNVDFETFSCRKLLGKLGTEPVGDDVEPPYFKGQIDELRIWGKALNRTEIEEASFLNRPIPSSGDLLHHYPMDEGSGFRIYDQIANTTGIIYTGVTWLESSRIKKF
jgi:hypothetical protein